MSTTDNASAAHGIPRDASLTRSALPSFTPARDPLDRRYSQAESSTSGSRGSAAERLSRGSSAFQRDRSSIASEDGIFNQSASIGSYRRNHNRSSGGFLLESTTHSSRVTRAALSFSHEDVKGKRRSDGSESSLPKRRSILEQDSTWRSSPLSVEVRRDDDKDENMQVSKSVNRSETQQAPAIRLEGSQRSGASSIGLETDPAQIVDMALKLSEGKRRKASGRRFVSGDASRARVVSSSSARQPGTPTRGLGQYIISPNGSSPPAVVEQPDRDSNQPTNHDPMTIDQHPSGALLNEYPIMDHSDMEISRATAVRVEKAKVYLELAYEHRRLLTHLPPIRRPGNLSKPSNESSDSKLYNPLQYVRNRKLRIREKSAINAEEEGWHDTEKVRAWVDAVVNSHSEVRHDPLECVRLPPLSLQEGDDHESRSPGSPKSPRSPKYLQTRPRRPKSDWVTHPGDLVADAFWLEQGLNKTKIHDRDNHPIYPPNTSFRFSGWRNRTPAEVPERLQQQTPPPDEPDSTLR